MEKLSEEYRKTVCIYRVINNITNKSYVGSTINLYKRISSHIKLLNERRHHNFDLQNDWSMYKAKNFTHEILEIVDDKDLLPILESEYIETFRNPNGVYNISDPLKENLPYRTEESRKYELKSKDGEDRLLLPSYVIDYLDVKFCKLVEKMKANIDDRKYYDKLKIDEWVLKRINDKEIRDDARLDKFIRKWYNSNGFAVVSSNIYKRHFMNSFGIYLKPHRKILVTIEMNNAQIKKKKS